MQKIPFGLKKIQEAAAMMSDDESDSLTQTSMSANSQHKNLVAITESRETGLQATSSPQSDSSSDSSSRPTS